METWNPVVGRSTKKFLRKSVNWLSRKRVEEEAKELFSNSVNPAGPAEHRTGIAIGRVQSGKTLSFQTLMSLARDNGYPVVILFAGVSNLLLGQSIERNFTDLGIKNWRHIKNLKTIMKHSSK